MTEVMVHSLLDGSFSFSGSKFNHITASNESEMLVSENEEYSTVENLSEKMDTTCDNSSESTICDSYSDDSTVSNSHVSEVNTSDITSDNSLNSTLQSNISSKEYEIVATKTTVINTTYNLISQSSTTEIKNMTTSREDSSWANNSPCIKKEAVGKSRVVVQILKSDLKGVCESQNAIEESAITENQIRFRDDMFKLFSKSRCSEFENTPWSQERSIEDACNVPVNKSSVPLISLQPQDTKTNEYDLGTRQGQGTARSRRKRSLFSYFMHGRGMKIYDLKCVCDNLRVANPISIQNLQYIMFSINGTCSSGLQLLQARKNIHHFCGFPFKRSSEEFQKKLKCLKKSPIQMLIGMHKAIFGKTKITSRSELIQQLIDFLIMPRKCSEILKNERKNMSTAEYSSLVASILNGPTPKVVLQKLSKSEIRRFMNNDGFKKSGMLEQSEIAIENETAGDSSDTVPAYILKGPGVKLKFVPEIVNNVQNASNSHVKILHYVLYGRIESMDVCRRNILEFNGFSECQQEFAAEREAILKSMDQKELFQLCCMLCLRAKTNSRIKRIKKILDYLNSPSKPILPKSFEASVSWPMPISSRSIHLDEYLPDRSSYKSHKNTKPLSTVSPDSNLEVPRLVVTSPMSTSMSSGSDELENDDGYKLRDFRTISSNVECAAPSDLIELNDLLFIRTCDESEIHQKILDFTRFNFSIKSYHYDYRKTLMHYMGFCAVRKIARLLDIENWEKSTSQEDLSTNILKFLMKKKETDTSCSKSSLPSFPKSLNNSNFIAKQSSSSKSVINTSILEKPSSPDSVTNNIVIDNSETPKRFKSEVFQKQDNQAISHHRGKVFIQKLTKASVDTASLCKSNASESLQMDVKGRNESHLPDENSVIVDNSTRLRDLIHHPTGQELKNVIYRLVKENLWNSTLGDLVQKVYERYPKVDLSYRERFIKEVVRQMLSELRDYAIDTVRQLNF